MKDNVKKAFLMTIPVMSGYLVLGIGFGILLQKSGYGVWWAVLMSGLIYAGSMQYVAISLMDSGATVISTALTTLMVNARHLFYGVSMVDKYKDTGIKKGYLMFALTDETYSLVCNGEHSKDLCFLISLFNQCYWVTGSVLGSILGAKLTFDTSGIEFSMTALFVTVLVEQWLSNKRHLPAIIGVGMSVLSLMVFGRKNFLIPAMLMITLLLMLFRKHCEGGGHCG